MQGLQLTAERIAMEARRGVWADRVITEFLDRWIAEKPGETAVVSFKEESGSATRLSWSELGDRVGAIARGLSAAGIGKGDVVSFQLPNWWEFVAIHLACVRLGAISNPLMPIFRRRELSFMLRHTESKVFIAPAMFRGFDHGALALEMKAEIPSLEHVFLVGGAGEHSFEDNLLGGVPAGSPVSGTSLDPNDVVQLLFTSGTTGESKGVLHTSNTLIGTILQFIERMQLGPQDVVFMPSPLAHQAGFAYGMTLATLVGIPLVLLDVWNPASAVALMEAHRATYTFAATPFLNDLANFPGIETRALERFRMFATSGAPIPPVLVQLAQQKFHASVVASWGMTECCSVTTTLPSGHKVLESDGFAVKGAEARICAANGNEAPRGAAGLLKIRGPSLFVGYLKRPNLYSVDENGWFNTGDIARMDDEGYIRICGREKDIIIRGGENIPVVEVEAAMYKIPQVAEVAIVAMPDPRMSERACAFVTLRPGARLSFEEMQTCLGAAGLSKHFWPERLEVIEKMPWTAAGKIQKYVLREMAKNLSPSATVAVA